MVVLGEGRFLMSEVPLKGVGSGYETVKAGVVEFACTCKRVSLNSSLESNAEEEEHVGGGAPPPLANRLSPSRGPQPYRVTSLIRNRLLLGPYSRTMPRVIQWTWGGLQFLMSEVAL